jgi:hypothetical protein
MQKELLIKNNNFQFTTSIQTYNNNFIYCIIKFENYFLISTSNGYIISYNLNTYRIKQILKLSHSSIKYLYLLKENYILYCTLDGELKIIEIKNGFHNDIQILDKNNRETIKKCIQFSNGKLICSCQERNIKFWKKENNGNAYLYDKEININPKFIYNIIEINDNEICSIEKEDTKYYINFYNINENKIINSILSFKELLLQTQSAIKYDNNLLIVGADNGLMFINYIEHFYKGLIKFESKPWCIYKLLNNNLLIGDSFGNLFNIKIIDKDKLEIKILNKTNKVLNRMINNILEIKDKNNNKIIVGGNDEFFKIYEFFN